MRPLSLPICSHVFVFFLFFVIRFSVAQPNEFQEKTPLTIGVDKVIDSAIAENRIVGTEIIVSLDGKIVYRRAAGFADRETQTPVREDTLFRLASVSKAFTSMAVAALVHQGKIGLDDPVTKYLPEFTPKTADGKTPTITIRQLLAHTAGLNYGFLEEEDGPYHKAGVSDGIDNSDITLEENLKRLASVPLLFEPGTAWQYSLSVDVLGAVVAKANGTTFPEALQQRIVQPLKIKDVGFGVMEKNRPRLAVPYYNTPSRALRMADEQFVPTPGGGIRFVPTQAFNPDAFPSGGGGLIATASDVMLLLEAIRNDGGPIAGANIMKEMNTNQLAPGVYSNQPGFGFGLGWAVLLNPTATKTPQSPGTLTWGGAYGNYWFIDQAKKLSVAVLTNTMPEGMDGRFPNDVRDAIYGNIPQGENSMKTSKLYSFTVKDIQGEDFSLEKLKGKKAMIVNVASKCGLTPQYEQLQAHYAKYGGDGKFVIIGFPANNFNAQEPGTNAEIAEFCSTRFRVTFPMMEKISIMGDDMHPLYRYLTKKEENGVTDAPVTWNFQKFLFDEQGNLVAVVPPKVKPDIKPVIDWLEGRTANWTDLENEK